MRAFRLHGLNSGAQPCPDPPWDLSPGKGTPQTVLTETHCKPPPGHVAAHDPLEGPYLLFYQDEGAPLIDADPLTPKRLTIEKAQEGNIVDVLQGRPSRDGVNRL